MDSCTLYIDASGDPGWVKSDKGNTTEWYTMSGVVFTPNQDMHAKAKIDEILGKYIPSDVREAHPDQKYELHYADLICGNNIYHTLERNQKKAMADEVFNFLLGIQTTLISTSVNKRELKASYGEKAWNPKLVAIRSVVAKFSMYLTRHDMIGYIVFDEEDYKNDKRTRDAIYEFKKYGTRYASKRYAPSKMVDLHNVLNTIQFCPSELSPGIQCADFVARAIWNHHERGKSDRYRQIEPLWERDGEKTYGDTALPS